MGLHTRDGNAEEESVCVGKQVSWTLERYMTGLTGKCSGRYRKCYDIDSKLENIKSMYVSSLGCVRIKEG